MAKAIERPNAREAEKALIGALLINPAAYATVAPIVDAADFYLGKARFVYEAIEALKEAGEVPDVVTIADELERRGRLEEIGGVAYLAELEVNVPTALHAGQYARRVVAAAQRRGLLDAASEIAKVAYNEGAEIEEAQAQAEAAVLDTRRDGSRTVTAAQVFGDLYEAEWADHGLPTGIDALDKMLGGLEAGLYLLAARPSMGKTAMALQIAANLLKRGQKVVVFTLEMGAQQLALRMACSEARVELNRVKRDIAIDQELGKVTEAIGTGATWPLVIHTGTVTAGDIRAVVQRETMRGAEVGLVVVDYLGLMAAAKQAETRNLELGAISRGLLLAAKDLDVPILALHQLNRGVDSRSERRPVLSDLRESGRLEEDADVVLMLYRDGYYWPDSERANVMEIWVRKNRLGGPAGVRCEMYWHGEYMRLEPLERGALEL